MKRDRTKRDRTKVMFVCLGNSCRSPMAEAIATRLGSDVMEASSAGLTALGHVQGLTKETLVRNGYPADGLASKQLQYEALEAADIVVNMSGLAAVFDLSEPSKVEDWMVEDPYGTDEETYQRIFEEIERRVAKLADRLRKPAQERDLLASDKGKHTKGQLPDRRGDEG